MTHKGSVNYWSCVAYSASNAWNYNNNGMSNNNTFTNTWLRARPVTKLEIEEHYMNIEDLYKAYRVCRKHNRRSRDMSVFEIDLYGRLYALCNAVNARTYVPRANYAFIHYRPRPREVFAAEPELKILMAHLDIKVNAIIDAKLSDRAFNNRIGKGTHAAVNRVIDDICECSQGFTNPNCWVIKADLRGYFPNINQQKAYDLIENILVSEYDGDDKDDLLYIAKVVCFANPQERCDKRSQLVEWSLIPSYKSLFYKPFGIGGAIGFLFWQVMSNYYLCQIDRWIMENITPRYVRFVDDMVFVTDNKESALIMIGELRRRLEALDVRLHPDKFYCQHATKGLEFLGYHIKRDAVHVNRKIRERAMRLASQGRRRHYLETMNSYLGILKSGSDIGALADLMNRIPNKYNKDYKNWKINEKDNEARTRSPHLQEPLGASVRTHVGRAS